MENMFYVVLIFLHFRVKIQLYHFKAFPYFYCQCIINLQTVSVTVDYAMKSASKF